MSISNHILHTLYSELLKSWSRPSLPQTYIDFEEKYAMPILSKKWRWWKRKKPSCPDKDKLKRELLETMRRKVVEYDASGIRVSDGMNYMFFEGAANNGHFKDSLHYLKKTQKQVAYGSGFCTMKNEQIRKSSFCAEWNAHFSRQFNAECEKLYKRLLADGAEKVKQDILLLADYYLEDLGVLIQKDYLKLKLKEADIRFQIAMQKAQEKEEAKAQKELAQAIRKADQDELLAREQLAKERKALSIAEDEQKRAQLEQRIAQLEKALQEAEERHQRAVSMAQITRAGYVYIISNEGSFGKGVYKIGMTRRPEPMQRVIELGDASVPFPFQVHAFIYSQDAPTLEADLHRHFATRRVNNQNLRKEFFRVELDEIKDALQGMGIDVWLNGEEG